MWKRTLSVSAILSMALLISLGSFVASTAGSPVDHHRLSGKEVTFSQPIERVIVLNSDAAEAVSMLGAADKVVGVSDTVLKKGYYFPQLKKKQNIGKWNQPDYEMIGEIAKGGGEKHHTRHHSNRIQLS